MVLSKFILLRNILKVHNWKRVNHIFLGNYILWVQHLSWDPETWASDNGTCHDCSVNCQWGFERVNKCLPCLHIWQWLSRGARSQSSGENSRLFYEQGCLHRMAPISGKVGFLSSSPELNPASFWWKASASHCPWKCDRGWEGGCLFQTDFQTEQSQRANWIGSLSSPRFANQLARAISVWEEWVGRKGGQRYKLI